MNTRTIRTTFAGGLGHDLAARLDLPSGPVRAYALFAHCFACTKDIIAARHIAAKLASLGIAALRFDFTGLGSSEGEFQNTNFSSNVGDLIAAADHLRSRYQAPSILIGHSLGGAAVLAAAPQIPEAKAVVTIGAPSDVTHVLRHFQAHLGDIRTRWHRQRNTGWPYLSDQSRARGGCQGPVNWATRRQPAESIACHARPAGSNRRYRACRDYFHAGKAPQELRFSRQCGPSALKQPGCRIRRRSPCGLGVSIPHCRRSGGPLGSP